EFIDHAPYHSHPTQRSTDLHRLTKDTKTGQSAHSYTYDDTQFLLDRRVGGSPVIEFEKSADGSHQVAEYHEGLHPTVTYDDAGNLVEKHYGGSLTEKFYYDHENRIAHIDGAVTDFWFRYDALGRCVAQKTGSTETFFFYSGLHIVEETTTGLSLNRLTLFGNRIDEILISATISGGSLANHRFPYEDALGSLLEVRDSGGSVRTTFTYNTAYGETSVSGTESSYPYGFTGRRIIGDPGISGRLYDYRARVYDPKLGRFLQRDPVGTWGDATNLGNAYAYVGGDVANKTDPTGMFWTRRGNFACSFGASPFVVTRIVPGEVSGFGGSGIEIREEEDYCLCSRYCRCPVFWWRIGGAPSGLMTWQFKEGPNKRCTVDECKREFIAQFGFPSPQFIT